MRTSEVLSVNLLLFVFSNIGFHDTIAMGVMVSGRGNWDITRILLGREELSQYPIRVVIPKYKV